MTERTDTFKERLLKGLKEPEFVKLGLEKNPFIPYIPKEIISTFVNRDKERNFLVRYLPDLINGTMPVLVLSGSKGIGKTHFLHYIFQELKEVADKIEHEIIVLDNGSFREFFNKIKMGGARKYFLVLMDDTEKIWESAKEEFVALIEQENKIKFICVWNSHQWSQVKQDPFYASLKPACIKIEKLTPEHLIQIANLRITKFLIKNKSNPFTLEALHYLSKVSDGIPYTMVYFCERALHYALDNNLLTINEQTTREFIEKSKLRQLDITRLTETQLKVLKVLLNITNSEQRGATSTDVARALDIKRPTAIEHLRNLYEKNLVEEKIEAKKKYYLIKPIIMEQLEAFVLEES